MKFKFGTGIKLTVARHPREEEWDEELMRSGELVLWNIICLLPDDSCSHVSRYVVQEKELVQEKCGPMMEFYGHAKDSPERSWMTERERKPGTEISFVVYLNGTKVYKGQFSLQCGHTNMLLCRLCVCSMLYIGWAGTQAHSRYVFASHLLMQYIM